MTPNNINHFHLSTYPNHFLKKTRYFSIFESLHNLHSNDPKTIHKIELFTIQYLNIITNHFSNYSIFLLKDVESYDELTNFLHLNYDKDNIYIIDLYNHGFKKFNFNNKTVIYQPFYFNENVQHIELNLNDSSISFIHLPHEEKTLTEINFLFSHYGHNQIYWYNEQKNLIIKTNQKHLLHEKSSVEYYKLNYIYDFLCDDSIEFNHQGVNSSSKIEYCSFNHAHNNSSINSILNLGSVDSSTYQNIRHILLEDKAVSFSKPNLIIKEKQVQAKHSNTIIPYEKNSYIYLKQRGFTDKQISEILNKSLFQQKKSEFFPNEISGFITILKNSYSNLHNN